MPEPPNFFNVGKMAFILGVVPFAFLLSIALSDYSVHQLKTWQSAQAQVGSR